MTGRVIVVNQYDVLMFIGEKGTRLHKIDHIDETGMATISDLGQIIGEVIVNE